MIKNIKSNNKGFSLVELILAVVILGVVISPLLHSFVTATNIFAKSRNISQLTATGQNILETIDARPIKEFVEGGELVKELLTHRGTTPEFYELGISDYTSEDSVAQVAIKNLATADGTYDARVTFSRGQALTGERVGFDQPENGFKLVNSKELAKFSNMDAVYTQKYGKENPEEKLLNDIISFFPALSSLIDKSAGIKQMDRMIIINAEVDEANKLIFVTLTYNYEASTGVHLYKKDGSVFRFPQDMDQTIPDGTLLEKTQVKNNARYFLMNLAYEYNILPGGYDYSDDLENAKDINADGTINYKDIRNLSIYVMYYANYTGTDNIQIWNDYYDINLNVFIVKMNPLKPIYNAMGNVLYYEPIKGLELNNLEVSPRYATVIEWVLSDEYADLEAYVEKKNDFLFTNAPINLYLEEYYNYDSKIYDKSNTSYCLNSTFDIWIGVAAWYELPDSRVSYELVKKNSDPRIYNVTIDLYPVNSCTISTKTEDEISTQIATYSEEPLYTLQGTKTN